MNRHRKASKEHLVSIFANQYKRDFFNKLNFPFYPGLTLLDVGCGDGTDGVVFRDNYRLKYTGIDIYKHENIDTYRLPYTQASIYTLPFRKEMFDYVFSHDVLHHIDEPEQRKEKHIAGLRSMRNVCKTGGYVILAEGNRYNPLFYPHMVKMHKHEHFRQSYLQTIIKEVFVNDRVHFHFFEAHFYPKRFIGVFKLFEYLMEHLSPRAFLAYNIAIVQKQ